MTPGIGLLVPIDLTASLADEIRHGGPAVKQDATKARSRRLLRILFLGRRNAVRSQMAECLMNSAGAGMFRAYSAGYEPAPAIHPLTRELLEKFKLPTGQLFCKQAGVLLCLAKPRSNSSSRCASEVPSASKVPGREIPYLSIGQ